MHNIPMNNYSNHVAIIGAGISGLTLGCILKSANIPVVIFEKSLTISNQGAGISISPNGINVLKHLGIYDEIKNQSANPKLAEHFSNNNIISSFSVDVLTTSRQTIYQTLLNKYQSVGGDMIMN
jgi:2-polyprenyl-6-methoxyphenol hydroxylase-like FAD-dependent oxidoreductase